MGPLSRKDRPKSPCSLGMAKRWPRVRWQEETAGAFFFRVEAHLGDNVKLMRVSLVEISGV